MDKTYTPEPLSDFIIVTYVKDPEDETKAGGIIVPDTAKKRQESVCAKIYKVGKNVTEDLKLGDIVVIHKFSGHRLGNVGEPLWKFVSILKEHIFCKLKEGDQQ